MGLNITQTGSGISKELTEILISVSVFYLNTFVAILGITGNAVNIRVIVKQGFGDVINISLFALAIADAEALLTSLFTSLCYSPVLVDADLPVDLQGLQSIVASSTRGTFTRTSSCVTAFITLERCLCVVLPLKVNEVNSNRFTWVVMVAISVTMAVTLIPYYLYSGLGWKYDSKRNRAVLGVVMVSYSGTADLKGTIAVHTFVQIASYGTITVFTLILLSKLKQYSQRREQLLSGNSENSPFRGNRKLNKTLALVTTLAVIYLVCYAPGIATLIGHLAIEQFYIYGKLANYFTSILSFSLLLENVNSAMSLLLYYSMSSSYRRTHILCKGQETSTVRSGIRFLKC